MIRFLSAGLALALLASPAAAQQVTTPLGSATFGAGPIDGSNNQPICIYDKPGGQCMPFLTRNGVSHSVSLSLPVTLPALTGDVTSTAGSAVTSIASGAVTSGKLASGVAVANLGYTPVNKAGDTMTGPLNISGSTINITTPVPSWTAGASIVDSNRNVVNGFPLLSEFGSGTVPLYQANVTAVSVPSTSTLYQSNTLAGYATTGGSTTAIVGVYGQFSVSGEGAGQANGDGVNGLCTNSATQNGTTGFDLLYLACVEGDVNIQPLASTAAPTGSVYGLYTAGASSILPTGDFSGVFVGSPGSVRWKSGLKTKDGSSTVGVNIGSNTANSGSTTSGSQSIVFNSYLSGASKSSNIQADAFGNIITFPAPGASTVFTNGAGTTEFSVGVIGPILPSFTVANLPVCNGSGVGVMLYATDLTAPTYNGTLTGGGTVKRPVSCNGTAWVS